HEPNLTLSLEDGLSTTIFQRGFFISSRRRHTRFSRDWSSDVCSSDLEEDAQQTGDDTGDRGNHGQDLVALLGALLAVAGLAVTRGRLALRRGRESTAGGVRRLRREPARLGLGAGLLVHRLRLLRQRRNHRGRFATALVGQPGDRKSTRLNSSHVKIS